MRKVKRWLVHQILIILEHLWCKGERSLNRSFRQLHAATNAVSGEIDCNIGNGGGKRPFKVELESWRTRRPKAAIS